MLSVTKIQSAGALVKYVEKEALLNYYDESGVALTRWSGEGANFFSLSGPVQGQALNNLLEGRSPDGTADVVQNAGATHRQPGWDLTFSAVKDFSTCWGASDTETRKLLDRTDEKALNVTLSITEEICGLTRRGKGGRALEKAKLIFALYAHRISREGQPQIHTHVICPNVGIRGDLSTGTIWTKELYRSKIFLGTLYRVEHAKNLRHDLGLHVEPQKIGFRIVGVPQSLSRYWSRRSEKITALLKERGQSGAVAARVAAEDTRPKKPEIPIHILSATWRAEALLHGFSSENVLRLLGQAPAIKSSPELLEKALLAAWAKSQANHEKPFRFLREAGRLAILHAVGAIELKDALERIRSRQTPRPTKTAEVLPDQAPGQKKPKRGKGRGAKASDNSEPANIPPQPHEISKDTQTQEPANKPGAESRKETAETTLQLQPEAEAQTRTEARPDISPSENAPPTYKPENAQGAEAPLREDHDPSGPDAVTRSPISPEHQEGTETQKDKRTDKQEEGTKLHQGGEPISETSFPEKAKTKAEEKSNSRPGPSQEPDSNEVKDKGAHLKSQPNSQDQGISSANERTQNAEEKTKSHQGFDTTESASSEKARAKTQETSNERPRAPKGPDAEQPKDKGAHSNARSNSQDQGRSSNGPRDEKKKQKARTRSFRRQWQGNLRTQGIDLDGKNPWTPREQIAANEAFRKEFTESVERLRPEWQSTQRLQRLAYLAMVKHRAHPEFVDRTVVQMQHAVEAAHKAALVAEERAKIYRSLGMDPDGKGPWTREERKAANKAFAREFIETVRRLPPEWQTAEHLQRIGYDLMLKHRPQNSLVDRAVAGSQEAVKAGHDEAVRAKEWAQILRDVGPDPRSRIPWTPADQKAADKAFRRAFVELVEKIPPEHQTAARVEALARGLVVEHRLHPSFVDHALENLVPLADAPFLRIEKQRLFPKSPIKFLREQRILKLAVGPDRLNWGKIHWKQNLLIGELRIQDRRLFPNSPQFLHIHNFALPRFHFVPRFPSQEQIRLAKAKTGWKPAFMHKKHHNEGINQAQPEEKDQPTTERELPRLHLVTKEPHSLPKEQQQENEKTSAKTSKLQDQDQSIAYAH